MTRRMILPLLFGLAGCAILIALGSWQMQRLAWKQAILAQISARLADTPVALPTMPDPTVDKYLPVRVAGRFTGTGIDVLASLRGVGAGYRVIAAFQTDDGRRIMIDRGFLPEDQRDRPRKATVASILGTLHWPDETDSFTPPPDTARAIWFARDVPAMAAVLQTEPVLIVAREATGDGITPLPVDTQGIPNNHLNYAVTWFSLAAVWAGMTGLLLWRIRRRTD
ncbi:MAG: SURF1 family protein [Rhodobacter sp.]|nr:SURF1 family protein [Rhodobacter sp.]MCA3462531.1 SURF1 family protein [Rhodobacter sp.]MCA3464948.1 SURF1 family protein [Rhodobacter sp.]MCA3466458.1 SURF1 family protein [Rhodobacter sp.]MCA3472479.1 SURF1 family protein [Rhodobacter sp.]